MSKTLNNYALAVGRELYDATPKAVFAALAVSALTSGGDELEQAAEKVLAEWAILHANAIVPQAPPSKPTSIDPELPTLAESVLEIERSYWTNSFPQPHGQPDGVTIPRCTPLRVILDAVTEILPEAQRPRVTFGSKLAMTRLRPPGDPGGGPADTREEQ